MPKGPKGEKRPADAVGAAVMVAKIATGEIEDELTDDGKDIWTPLKQLSVRTLILPNW